MAAKNCLRLDRGLCRFWQPCRIRQNRCKSRGLVRAAVQWPQKTVSDWIVEGATMPEGFLSLIVTMLPAFREIEKRLDRETGRRFNTFNLFATNENATSRILAFLLDPKDAHGQNDVFLRLFVQRFVPEWQRAFNYSVAHRALTGERIDVVISDGPHWLGIENKIFNAPEITRQAGKYLDALCGAPSQEDYRLVYLSPKGAPPLGKAVQTPTRASMEPNLYLAPGRRPRKMRTNRRRHVKASWIGSTTAEVNAGPRTWRGL